MMPEHSCERGHNDWCLDMATNTWFCEMCRYEDFVKNNPEEVEAHKERGRQILKNLGWFQ